ncbi:MAG: copper amine oxidase N-terminal domain-containing protein [Anaerotignum sp.]|nr:copper amine oxidase N-terminal domain-containing protein [Anaerotignum sp.]
MKHMKKMSMVLVFAAVLSSSTQCLAAEVKVEGLENGKAINLEKIGGYDSGFSNKDGGVAEIISHDKMKNQAWVVNGATGKLDILSLDQVTGGISEKMSAKSLDIPAIIAKAAPDFQYGDMTSVAVHGEKGIVAVALQDVDYNKHGYAAILTTDEELLTMMEAGCQPDNIVFTPDGRKILVANEGEPREGIGEGIVDPAGSVTVITLDAADVQKSTAVTVDFEVFDSQRETLIADGIIMVKDNLPSVDFEPEYITATDQKAYIALQENNAIAVLDLDTKEYSGVYSLGYKDLSGEKDALDLVEDGVYEAKTYDAVSAYMPDGIAVYETDGKTYILTANEGDAREWGDYCNEIKATVTATDGTEAENVRVINAEVTDGLPEGKTVLYGARSFSIYRVDNDGLTQVFDSGNDFEVKTAGYFPSYFNISNDDNAFDSRSPKKGPEPESVVIGKVEGRTYAFVALERIGGIMVYDITHPEKADFCNYINTRDFSEDPEAVEKLTGDIAPEGLAFIPAEDSHSATPVLLAAYEVSGTVGAYAVAEKPAVPETMIKLEIGSEKATVNDETKILDVPAFTEQGRTFLPIRFVAEALGANVNWDAATKTVVIWK